MEQKKRLREPPADPMDLLAVPAVDRMFGLSPVDLRVVEIRLFNVVWRTQSRTMRFCAP